MKRVIALGILSASFIVAPSAAFAGDSQVQTNEQYTEQNGAATDGSINTQDSRSENFQRQEIKNRNRRNRRRDRKYYDDYDRKYDDYDRYDDDDD